MNAFDPEQHRRASAEHWEEAAPGWVRRQRAIRELGAPVSHWMLRAIDPQPGQRVLELAAGLGETGLQAAELVAPNGSVILSDQAEGMLAGARARAAELALANVEYLTGNAEWIDLPVASVDAVLCRWGYMLMADPPAALSETRRVLRPSGRLALAVWDAAAANPWARLPMLELVQLGLAPGRGPAVDEGRAASGEGRASGAPPNPAEDHEPGPFALGDPDRVRALLEHAGFVDVLLDAVEVCHRYRSFDAYWETTLDISRVMHDIVLSRPQGEIEEIRAAIAARLAPYTAADGSLELPGRSLVAAASA